MRRIVPLALLAAIPLSGCGGSSQALTSNELTTQATRVCQIATRQTNLIRSPATPAGTELFLKRGIAALTPELAGLRALHAPSDVDDVYSASVSAFAKKLDAMRTTVAGIDSGQDPVTALQALQQQIGPLQAQENGGWQALQIPACLSR